MSEYIKMSDLQVSSTLANFVQQELLPAIDMSADDFWQGLSTIIGSFTPRNRELLKTREKFQLEIDEWHNSRRDLPHDEASYKKFLQDISYLVAEGDSFSIDVRNVDPEISIQAGPQLVVPVKNARFALNAANARWGSLYDALYGSDAIPEEDGAQRSGGYNPVRGDKVIHYARNFLDQACPLLNASHVDSVAYRIVNGKLLVAIDGAGQEASDTSLLDTSQLLGFNGDPDSPSSVLLKNNDLHIEIQIDPSTEIGQADKAGIKDLVLEAAITTIQDCEDSVAAVDAEDKVEVYRNWLGLMSGQLKETFIKGGKPLQRVLAKDRVYTSVSGENLVLPGRSLLLVRNVGHLMSNPAILDFSKQPVFEGILDAVITTAIGRMDIDRDSGLANSRTGSIYIVKPKMHGPDEVQFSCDVFAAVENFLGLETNTVKIGIMDEERRTTVNLKECIRVAKERVVFINTGFLDRTGDEIHTSMQAGAMIPKAEMKASAWIKAYENNNVDVGLACGLQGKAQIGKGMWAMPDLMARMLDEKIGHPQSGANTAWVPSPTAAVLHAMHYHLVNVREKQNELKSRQPASLDDILTIPLVNNPEELTAHQIQQELENNAQGILGYVVRWIDEGIGCSKVPDIHNIDLMEDRATLRISSQHIANWLVHNICSKNQVTASMEKMATIVDKQNENDPSYKSMSPDFDNSIAFQAACDLVFRGTEQTNGYTEPFLHARRLEKKAQS